MSWNSTALPPPGYYAKTNKDRPGQLKKAKCNAPIPGKANRRIPHFASACLLFEQADNPPSAVKP